MLFPARLPDLLSPDLRLAAALTTAQAELALASPALGVHSSVAISVVVVNESTSGPPTFGHAGIRETEMDFSGSLLKIAAMLAALELRQSVSDHTLHSGDCSADVVFADLKTTFDPQIAAAAPRIAAQADTANLRAPKYATIFGPPQPMASGGCMISFAPDFANSLRQMIVPSNNDHAAACIKALGFSWINAVLARTGLFDEGTAAGIWLAGTFGGGAAVRVPSANDGPSAQATTCIAMARFMALLVQGTALDDRSVDGISGEMRELLSEAQLHGDSSFMTSNARPGIVGLGSAFTITHCKIGLGSLNLPGKPGVASEATILRHDSSGRQFIVIWQNLRNSTAHHNGVTRMGRRAIELFVAMP